MKIKRPTNQIQWWLDTISELAYQSAKDPDDKNLATTLSKVSFAANVFGNLSKQDKDAAAMEELKKQVAHILSVKNRDAVK